MKIFVVLFTFLLVMGSFCVPGQSQAGEGCSAERDAAIKQAALNYVEGWYTGDAERMRKALHPKLAKRWIKTLESGEVNLIEMTSEQLVESARKRKGETVPDGQKIEVIILDVYKKMAAVRVNSPWFVDYVHLANWNGEWLITNVLWE